MKILRSLIFSIVLFSTFSLFACPQNSLPQMVFHLTSQGSTHLLTYDEILNFLDELESGELEKKCSPAQLEQINQFLVFLAKEGVLPNDLDEGLTLEEDAEDLLNSEDSIFEHAFLKRDHQEYMSIPAVFSNYSNYEIMHCGKISSAWKKTKNFLKKHKKEVIIGAVVVVATVAVVVVAATTGGAGTAPIAQAGAAAVGAVASGSNMDNSSFQADAPESLGMTPVLTGQVFDFKENIAAENFFQPSSQNGQGLSWEETGRVLGPLFAHESFNSLSSQPSSYPHPSREFEAVDLGHNEIDRRFSTNYTFLFSNTHEETDFLFLSHQMKGEKALAFGYYSEAVVDLGKAIDLKPTAPMPYLQRSASYFNIGEYEHSLEDFHAFVEQVPQGPKDYSLSIPEFTLGFAKGLPKGIYESGEGILLFLTDFVVHPIHTSTQVVEALSALVEFVRNDEWNVIGEVLSPEICQLVKEWDALSSDKRGELAGYAIGKHGGDILVPGALAKVASKSVKSANELATVCKNIKIANEVLVLETAAEIGSGAKVGEIVNAGKATAFLGEELGFTAQEMGQLKKMGHLEGAIDSASEQVFKDPEKYLS